MPNISFSTIGGFGAGPGAGGDVRVGIPQGEIGGGGRQFSTIGGFGGGGEEQFSPGKAGMPEGGGDGASFSPGGGGQDFLSQAGASTGNVLSTAQQGFTAHQQALGNYVQRLEDLKSMAQQSARSIGARAGGMQNPLAQYQAMNEMANQAGTPIEAEIAKALMGTGNIYNTLAQWQAHAAGLYSNLANVARGGTGASINQPGAGGGVGMGGGRRRSQSGMDYSGFGGPPMMTDITGRRVPWGQNTVGQDFSSAVAEAEANRMRMAQQEQQKLIAEAGTNRNMPNLAVNWGSLPTPGTISDINAPSWGSGQFSDPNAIAQWDPSNLSNRLMLAGGTETTGQ